MSFRSIAPRCISAATVLVLLVAPLASAEAGDLDPTFGGGDGVIQREVEPGTNEPHMGGIAIRPGDGRIVLAGDADDETDNGEVHLYGYTAEGLPWSGFGVNGHTIFDEFFDQSVNAIALLPDGESFVIVGNHRATAVDDPTSSYIAKFDAQGDLDQQWGDGGVQTLPLDDVTQAVKMVEVDDLGRIYVGGTYSIGPTLGFVGRLTPAGEFDDEWATEGVKTITFPGTSGSNMFGMTLLANGKVAAVGLAAGGSDAWTALTRLNPNGSYDFSFDGDGRRLESLGEDLEIAHDVEETVDGKLVVSGQAQDGSNTVDNPMFGWFARYKKDGTPDGSFGDDGLVHLDGAFDPYEQVRVWDLEVQHDQKLVGALEGDPGVDASFDHGIVRLNRDGSLDTSFAGGAGYLFQDWGVGDSTNNDIATELLLDDEGRALTAGAAMVGYFGVARYQTDPGTTTSAKARVKAGKVKVSGFVSPPHEGDLVKLKLQKKVGGNFTNVGSKSVSLGPASDKDSNGTLESRYSASFTPPGGTCRVKAMFSGDAVHDPSSDTTAPLAC